MSSGDLPAPLRRAGAGLLRRSGFGPMAGVLSRHPLLAQCLLVPAAGCVALGYWAGGPPGMIVGVYLVGLAAILAREGFAGLAGDAEPSRAERASIRLSHCRTGENSLPVSFTGRSR
ncbi:hypothetical protein JL100_035145 (plasmid) [Skermanella mucosa]|uniref:hypothetical protein n=1 Tax=Skermanella mucosa TaxID=1789672 RepID=UPI00192B6010|nr:hypothetical protein [Skermanella mucosa]UEM25298.1 hypothetical protein JL100_035145 [Skermanella mucosa]